MIRRLSIVAALCGAVALAGCGSSSSAASSTPLGAKSIPAIQLPAYVPGPLDGQSTPRALALRRPLAVMVENYDPDSRPQSGLSAASLVVESLAEDGITRFMALYLEHDAPKVGPVRSTRVYFDRWASAYHAILAHVGGNDDAQHELWNLRSVFNIDENKWEISLTNTGTPLFWRGADRIAPHNMYVGTAKLRAYAARQHQNWAYEQAYLLHKRPATLHNRGHTSSISVTFTNPLNPSPQPSYDVQYRYQRASNTYLRIMGGSPHIDPATGKALQPANIIVMKTGPAFADLNAGITPQSIVISNLNAGKALYFRDGVVQVGTWRQKDQFAPLRFYDRGGRPVSFNPGQTWLEVLPSQCSVSWSGS